MRLISFSMTKASFLDGTKTVTRRLGWKSLRVGTHLMGVEKAMGLKPGQKVVRLGEIVVTGVRLEPLHAINSEPGACTREGFPSMLPHEFVRHFCTATKCQPETVVTRIEFEHVK